VTTTPASRHGLHSWWLLALVVVIGLNALLFTTRAANPLIVSDEWSFVDEVVRPVPEGGFDVADLFFKRSALDHSQPLRKLVLLFHYRYFDLDFSIAAVVGLAFAFCNLALFWLAARPPPGARLGAGHALGFAALAAVYLSLNAPVVFNWPLLTLAYSSHTFMILLFLAAWRALGGSGWRSLAVVFLAALAMAIVTDDTGLVATIALVVAVALAVLRGGTSPRRGAGVAALAGAAYATYAVGYAWLVPGTAGAPGGAGPGFGELFARLLQFRDEAWQMLVTPLVAPVAHRLHLRSWVGGDAAWLETGIAVVALACHGWFWWRALRGRWNLAGFVATCLMLLFYGLVAGLLLGRISGFGPGYLWQPRYAVIYAWGLVALLLMALGQLGAREPHARSAPERARAGHFGLAAAAALLLGLQVPLSLHAWDALRYTRKYQERLALQMGALARQPARTPAPCLPQLTVCRFPEAQRVRLMRFLHQNQLNLFSPRFQARHRLYPERRPAPG
jgi:hypothetical protein